MKTIRISVVSLLLLLVGVSGNLFAQTDGHTVTLGIAKTNLLAVVGDASLTLGGGGAAEAGAAITAGGSDNTCRIRISSALSGGETRRITVGIDNNTLDGSGVDLWVTPTSPNESFQNSSIPDDYSGICAAKTKITSATGTGALDLVTDIKGICWTGTNDGDGYALLYEMELGTDKTFVPASYVVTYTLIDDVVTP